MRNRAGLALAVIAALWPAPGPASDGRIEINQARALAGNVTPGDTPGFPVTLNRSGSYLLTGNLGLQAESPNTPAIFIPDLGVTEAVEIDLNGFTITGPASCTGFAGSLTCSNTGSGDGIGSAVATEVVVRNGIIRNMGRWGVDLVGASRVEGVIVKHNGAGGVRLGFGGLVRGSIARDNQGNGFEIDAGTSIVESEAIGNRFDGYTVSGIGSSVQRSEARDNGDTGIALNLGTGSAVENAISGHTFGILADGPALLERNFVQNNTTGISLSGSGAQLAGNLITGSSSVGVNGVGSLQGPARTAHFLDNSIVNNGGAAFQGVLQLSWSFAGNVVRGNGGGDALPGGSILLECNLIGASRLCPP